MKFCILRSGSSGNCTLIENNGTRILLDAGGMSQRGFKELLQEVNLEPEQINGIIVTHLHSDHVNRSAITVCKKLNIPLRIHETNVAVLPSIFGGDLIYNAKIDSFANDTTFSIGSLTIQSFEISHDAPDVTSGFKIWDQDSPDTFITYASDLGQFPDSLVSHFVNARHIILESNHDLDMLWKNPKRTFIHKQRVTGAKGHLSNVQAATALEEILGKSAMQPQSIILCHLSEDHNTPDLAMDFVSECLVKKGFSPAMFAAHRHKKMNEICVE